jgi:hypothetical protein
MGEILGAVPAFVNGESAGAADFFLGCSECVHRSFELVFGDAYGGISMTLPRIGRVSRLRFRAAKTRCERHLRPVRLACGFMKVLAASAVK